MSGSLVVASIARAGINPSASNLGAKVGFSSSDFLSSRDPKVIVVVGEVPIG